MKKEKQSIYIVKVTLNFFDMKTDHKIFLVFLSPRISNPKAALAENLAYEVEGSQHYIKLSPNTYIPKSNMISLIVYIYITSSEGFRTQF